MKAPRRILRSVLGWPVETQLGARRNALVASTALTQLRREREEVEDFLAGLAAGPVAVTVATGTRRGVI